jgi:hypothetical protein
MYGRRIIVQPDGKILVGGIYDPPGPEFRGIVRFETDGSVDASFSCPLRDMPFALATQADGKILAGFQYPPYMSRFHADGNPGYQFPGPSGFRRLRPGPAAGREDPGGGLL